MAAMSGIITGIFGGIIRDILCNRTPQVLRENITLLAAFSVGLLLRMVPIRWRVSLPVFSYSQTRWD